MQWIKKYLLVVKALNLVRELIQTSLDQGRDDHGLFLMPKLILTEHVMRVLLRKTSSFLHSDLRNYSVSVWMV